MSDICKCKLCKRSRKVKRYLYKISDEKVRKFFRQIYESLNNVEFDVEWLAARKETFAKYLMNKKLLYDFTVWKMGNKEF
jgi:hypothetical protein